MYKQNALGYRSGLALCLTKVRSSRARCPVTALIPDALLTMVFLIVDFVLIEVQKMKLIINDVLYF